MSKCGGICLELTVSYCHYPLLVLDFSKTPEGKTAEGSSSGSPSTYSFKKKIPLQVSVLSDGTVRFIRAEYFES